MKHQSSAIDRWLLRQVRSQLSNLARSGSEHFGTTRQTINSRLRKLTDDGVLVSDGNTRARRYELVTSDFETRIKITPTLEEDQLWRTFAEDSLRGHPDIHLMPINAGEDVMRMVQWVERDGKYS